LALPDYNSVRERFGFLFSGFDRSIMTVAKRILSHGDVAVDIGAHVGLVTRPLAHLVGRRGSVYAFEPDPGLFDLLKRNVRMFPQVTASQLAMSDHSGLARFHLHPSSGMSNSLVNAWDGACEIQVKCMSFDEWTDQLRVTKVRLAKIDVEGAEPLVIRGMKLFMRRNPEMSLVVEFCPRNLGSTDREDELLHLLGESQMRVHVIAPSGALHVVSGREEIHQALNVGGYVNLFCSRV
jgi:FkbM family methyltransferase